MTKVDKLFTKILSGRSDQNIVFSELCNILKGLGLMNELREIITYFQEMILLKL